MHAGCSFRRKGENVLFCVLRIFFLVAVVSKEVSRTFAKISKRVFLVVFGVKKCENASVHEIMR